MIYAVYECDDWKSFDSMKVNNPFLMTTSEEKLENELVKVGDEKAIRECFKHYYSSTLISELNNLLDNYYVMSFED